MTHHGKNSFSLINTFKTEVLKCMVICPGLNAILLSIDSVYLAQPNARERSLVSSQVVFNGGRDLRNPLVNPP